MPLAAGICPTSEERPTQQCLPDQAQHAATESR